MEKLSANIKTSPVDPKNREEVIEHLRSSKVIQELLNRENIPFEEVVKHPYRFLHIANQQQKCMNCSGLHACKQNAVGFRPSYKYEDGVLIAVNEACSYKNEKEQALAHMKNYRVSDLGPEYQTIFFETTDITKEKAEYLQPFIQAQQACLKNEGVYLYGNMGSGKTYLAACCCNEMARKNKSVAFVHMPSFVSRLDALRKNAYNINDYDEVDYLGFVDFVVFDDIGAEHLTDYNRSLLLSILEKRMQHNRMTWFTSNEDLKSLENHFATTYSGVDPLESKRIMERIAFLAKPVVLIGEDRRKLLIDKR